MRNFIEWLGLIGKGERTVDCEAEDGNAEEDLDSPDWVYPGNSGGHYRSPGTRRCSLVICVGVFR